MRLNHRWYFYIFLTEPNVFVTNNRLTVCSQDASPTRCSNNYTMTCVKRDVLLLLDALDGERSYEIYPGFTIFQRRSSSSSSAATTGSSASANESLDAANSTQLDQMIAKRLNDYVESIDLRVKLLNPINVTARSVGNSMLERILPFLRMSKSPDFSYYTAP